MNRFMRTAAVVLVFAVAITLALVPSSSAKAAKPGEPTSIPPGWWVGTYLLKGGIDKGDTSAESTGAGEMAVLVSSDGKVNGSMDVAALGAAIAKDANGELAFTGDLELGGTASKLTMSGSLHMAGTVTAQGIKVPISSDIPASGSFTPDAVSCSLVTGDMATEGRAAQQAAGFSTSVTAKFVLKRSANKPTKADIQQAANELANGYQDALAALAKANQGPVTVAELQAALNAIEAIVAGSVGTDACGSSALLDGLRADTELHDQFAAAVERLINAGGASPDDLIDAMRMAAQLGLLSETAAGDAANDLLAALGVELNTQLSAAKAKGDSAAIAKLEVAAVQFGIAVVE